MKIYLAGGMESTWRARAKRMLSLDQSIDPKRRDKLCATPMSAPGYTQWDLFHIAHSDILLGYMEKDNPSGIGLALEIGYAKARGVLVVLVIDPEIADDPRYAIMLAAADISVPTLEMAADYINTFQLG